jgi:BlaI family penicillinase repressor
MPPSTQPTRAELAILRVLWANGPSSVRQVHDALAGSQPTRYTTTLKFIQIMTDKGLLVRSATGRKHVYHATDSEHTMQRHLLRDLLDRAFDGSSARLVVQALSARRASADELREIRQLIDAQEKANPAATQDTGTATKEKIR